MKSATLLRSQLDESLQPLQRFRVVKPPSAGWLKAIRQAMGMPLRFAAKRLNTAPQGIRYLEISEKEGSITLKNLRKAADGLDMELVYFLVPKEGTIQNTLKMRAEQTAEEIISRTARSMTLEGQGTSKKELNRAKAELTEELIRTLPRYLWR